MNIVTFIKVEIYCKTVVLDCISFSKVLINNWHWSVFVFILLIYL